MSLTNEQCHKFLMDLAASVEEYAGLPYPIPGETLKVHPSYRFSEFFENEAKSQEEALKASAEPDEDKFHVLNSFQHPRKTSLMVFVVRMAKSGKSRQITLKTPRVFDYALATMGLVCAWKIEAETKALEKLHSLVTTHAFTSYITTGGFLETSKRSGVTYWFRRLRPTVAMRETIPGQIGVLCSLCLHPIGYYDKTFGGSLVPTDDVIAHLLLMRGDEPRFWKLSNQHPEDAVQSDL